MVHSEQLDDTPSTCHTHTVACINVHSNIVPVPYFTPPYISLSGFEQSRSALIFGFLNATLHTLYQHQLVMLNAPWQLFIFFCMFFLTFNRASLLSDTISLFVCHIIVKLSLHLIILQIFL